MCRSIMQMSTTYLSTDAVVLDIDAAHQLNARWRPVSELYPFYSDLAYLPSCWPPSVARGSEFCLELLVGGGINWRR